MCGRAVVCQSRGRRRSQSMRSTLRKVGFVAALAEPVPESGCCERLALFGHEEGHVPIGLKIQLRTKRRQYRYVEGDARLLTAHRERFVADKLPPHSHNVAAGLPRRQDQLKGQPRPGAPRMPLLVLFDISRRPSPVRLRLHLGQLDADQGICGDQVVREAVIEKPTKRLFLVLGCCSGFLTEDRLERRLVERRNRLVAMLVAKSLQDGTAGFPRALGKAFLESC